MAREKRETEDTQVRISRVRKHVAHGESRRWSIGVGLWSTETGTHFRPNPSFFPKFRKKT